MRNSRRRTRLLAYPGRAARRKTRAGPWTCRGARRAANSGGSSACVSRRAGARGCGVREMRDLRHNTRPSWNRPVRAPNGHSNVPRGQKVVEALPWSKISGFPIPVIRLSEFSRMARQSETERSGFYPICRRLGREGGVREKKGTNRAASASRESSRACVFPSRARRRHFADARGPRHAHHLVGRSRLRTHLEGGARLDRPGARSVRRQQSGLAAFRGSSRVESRVKKA